MGTGIMALGSPTLRDAISAATASGSDVIAGAGAVDDLLRAGSVNIVLADAEAETVPFVFSTDRAPFLLWHRFGVLLDHSYALYLRRCARIVLIACG
jgi:hypothetical protein